MGTTERDRYAAYTRSWRQRHRERSERCLQRAEAARTAAERCARVLAERYGARRVWLFGSTLEPELFDERSDIDLAAEGVQDWLKALLACEAAAPGFEVTVVPIEDAVGSLRRRIHEEGLLLYGPP